MDSTTRTSLARLVVLHGDTEVGTDAISGGERMASEVED
jgi:hypothetical protein